MFLNVVGVHLKSFSLPTMSRADGLVQRRNVQHSLVVEGEGAHGRGSDNEENRHNDEEDIDSKETRFTLMEEVLLLGLKDEQVSAAVHSYIVVCLKLQDTAELCMTS